MLEGNASDVERVFVVYVIAHLIGFLSHLHGCIVFQIGYESECDETVNIFKWLNQSML